MEEKDILVTVRCVTYNHEPYIRQCLEGFIMQKTNFRFIAVVHDDASTDGTAEIVQEYANKYPNIILPILQKENQYSKGYDIIRKILDEHTHSKYVAICEGDDYWTDPLKLQKQFNWLENHPDYSACFHQAIIHYEGSDIPDEMCGEIEDKDYTGLEIFKFNHRPPTASFFMKTSIYDCAVYKKFIESHLTFGDTPTFLACAHEGKIRGMKDIMSVYRKHTLGVTNTFNSGTKGMLNFANDQLKIYKIFGNEYKKECIQIYVIDHINYFFINLKKGKLYLHILLKILFEHPVLTTHFLIERWK